MSLINLLPQKIQEELSHKSLLKVISGLSNFETQSVKQISEAAFLGGADLIDIACKPELVESAIEISSLPICVSSVDPKLFINSVKEGASLIEIGNYDSFYEQGITAEGIDLIIEEVGLDTFVDFVIKSEFLSEERPARKMNVRTKKTVQKEVEKIKSNKSDVVPRGTPKDTLGRARAERSLKKPKLAKPSAPAKKVEKSVTKVKPTQPEKTSTTKDGIKSGLRSKITSAVKKGVERHQAATKNNKFVKGVESGVKAVGKAVKDVHSVTQVNKSRTVNMQSYELEGDVISEDDVVKVEGKFGYVEFIDLVKPEPMKGVSEEAPPGREKQVKALKKKFPNDPAAPYKIAWAQHNKESFEIDKSAHKAAQKKAKIRNLAKDNTNPHEKAAAERKAGGPKLYGEGKSFGEYRKAVSSVFKKKETPPHKYPEGTKYKDPADAAKKKLKVAGQKAAGIIPDAADEYPERSSSK